ncbi:polysaccharide biosynthesis tyrosine autokinase [Flavobacterium sp. DG2-3]|uniref:GumC family protein n=1 Tax=Flavobacterium sp. DG2-3 TaxID=3068317 RepID=UPI00273E6AA5|nr:polysaccharide biosynthesis tyrosine autokinase [Flavobacterium sp. DG2-3]MDP5199618.1 polysaccharide biosynthesis tyrosine autokinase [Flavobacterium sp. DG2-3]
MQNQDFYDDFTNEDNEGLNFREQFEKYIIYWKWFLLSVVLGLLCSFVYLQYATSRYEATTTILVKDEKKGSMLSQLSMFSDLGFGSNMKSNVDNEIEILKSRTLVEKTIQKLNLNVTLYIKRTLNDQDIYGEAPIKVFFVNKSNLFDESEMGLKLKFLSPNTFTLEDVANEDESMLVSNKKEYKYGEKILTSIGTFIVEKTVFFEKKSSDKFKPIYIAVKPLDDIAMTFQKSLRVEPVSKTSSVVSLSVSDPVSQKAKDFLNTMVQIYNRDAAEDRNLISENTSTFITNRLILISEELSGVEQHVESFKKINQLADIESQAKLFIDGSNEYNKKGVETEIQLNVVSSLLDFLKKSNNSDLLPTNLISDQGESSSLMNSYNQLVLDRNRILKSATAENPAVLKLNEQISSLKSNISQSLKQAQSNLQIKIRDLKGQEGILKNKIEKIPLQERQFRVIERQQKVKEELYIYLLQKREETTISLAATEPNARVIDVAKEEKNPISPKKKIVYLAGILLGLIIPYGIIYTRDLFDTKIKSKLDLDGNTQIPFIGDIPTFDNVKELIKSESRDSSSEALRIVRTNLEFMLNSVPQNVAKTIFVTSTFAGEGKTLLSANLAATFALSGKRVLLIGMDIRSPKINELMAVTNIGLTNYLSSNEQNIQEYIVKHKDYKDLYVLPAGVIPPNPAELLMSSKIDELFIQLKKKYDYIIVDTAPVALVADTLLIAKNADAFAYVIRANKLDKRMLSFANSLYKEKKLPNMCIVLNDTVSSKGYGYGYGYNEVKKKKKWF